MRLRSFPWSVLRKSIPIFKLAESMNCDGIEAKSVDMPRSCQGRMEQNPAYPDNGEGKRGLLEP